MAHPFTAGLAHPFSADTATTEAVPVDECFEYNDHLRANGHLVAEVPLQPPETALTLYWKNGKVATTDGPYAETKEQLGGIQILEARDLNHATRNENRVAAEMRNSPQMVFCHYRALVKRADCKMFWAIEPAEG